MLMYIYGGNETSDVIPAHLVLREFFFFLSTVNKRAR